jgi:hypothetical protein
MIVSNNRDSAEWFEVFDNVRLARSAVAHTKNLGVQMQPSGRHSAFG